MNARERVLASLNFEEPDDHIPIHDTLWLATVERWHSEGLPSDIAPFEFFDFDMVWMGPDTSPLFPVKTLEETEEYIIETTPYGGVLKNHKDLSSTPGVLDYPVKSWADWERIKEHLMPSTERIDWDGRRACSWVAASVDSPPSSLAMRGRGQWRAGLEGNQMARAEGKFTCFFAVVGFDKVSNYINSQDAMMNVITQPDLLQDMYETDANLIIAMCEMMRQGGFHFDGAFLASDLGYCNGPFFSPHHYEEQLHPTHIRLFDYFHSVNMPVIMHSCGRVLKLLPYLVQAGLDCLEPLEAKAGMDLVTLKEEWHGKIAFMGGIDVRSMADPNPNAIEDEMRSKILVAKQGGGYIYHSDHTVPNDVSFSQYQRVLELAHKYGSYSKS